MTDSSSIEQQLLPDWPRILGDAPAGEFKTTADDFVVIEQLGFEPEGEGTHLWLWVEKRGIDTLQAINTLSRITGIHPRDIGYSGLKDRQAVTRQWLSLPLELLGQDTLSASQYNDLEQAGIHLKNEVRHPRKLKRGSHRSNQFILNIAFQEDQRSVIHSRWQEIVALGVPNYFGAQRFGYQGQNIPRARALLQRGWRKKDDRKGLMLSTARSYLFNHLLAKRVEQETWNKALMGEVLNLNGSASFFHADDASDEEISRRLSDFDIHPSGPLWGSGKLESQHEAQLLEQQLEALEPELTQGLQKAGVRMSRRALRLHPENATWQDTERGALLKFTLPKGAYATAVLRELISAEGL